jgi:hypothetical protein
MPSGNWYGRWFGRWLGRLDQQSTEVSTQLGDWLGHWLGEWFGFDASPTIAPKLIDRLIPKVDRIRQRINVAKVGVRRFQLFRVIRSWDGGEVGDGVPSYDQQEITPAPAIALADSRDALNGRGRVEVGSMEATEVSLTYEQTYLMPVLYPGQECYYKLVEMNVPQAQRTTFWILKNSPEADRCETVNGNIQWIMRFTRAEIQE